MMKRKVYIVKHEVYHDTSDIIAVFQKRKNAVTYIEKEYLNLRLVPGTDDWWESEAMDESISLEEHEVR